MRRDKPIKLVWKTEQVHYAALIDIFYQTQQQQWKPIVTNLPIHISDNVHSNTGMYLWHDLPDDLDEQLILDFKYHGWGRENEPVVNVSWYDAERYTQWLSQQTDFRYRLPTAAERDWMVQKVTTPDDQLQNYRMVLPILHQRPLASDNENQFAD